MQTPFGFKFGIHKWYLSKTGGGGVLFYAWVYFFVDLIVSLVQAKVEQK